MASKYLKMMRMMRIYLAICILLAFGFICVIVRHSARDYIMIMRMENYYTVRTCVFLTCCFLKWSPWGRNPSLCLGKHSFGLCVQFRTNSSWLVAPKAGKHGIISIYQIRRVLRQWMRTLVGKKSECVVVEMIGWLTRGFLYVCYLVVMNWSILPAHMSV